VSALLFFFDKKAGCVYFISTKGNYYI